MEELNDYKPPYVKNRRAVLGIIAVAFGFLLLASNFGYLSYNVRHVLLSWPMILIVVGLIQILNHKDKPVGYIVFAIGMLFLMKRTFNFPFDFWDVFWPSILIIVGVSLIFFHRSNRTPYHQETSGNNVGPGYLDEVNIFGGSKRKIANQEFRGGKITNIFGGTEIDLTKANLAEGTNVLEVTCIFGGMSMVVPSDWNIHADVVSIFGEFKDKRTVIKQTEDAKGQLIIKGVAIFGGGDVKSY